MRLMRNIGLIFCLLVMVFPSNAGNDNTDALIKILVKKYNTDKPLSYNLLMIQLDSSGKTELNKTIGSITSSNKMYKMSYPNYDIIVEDTLMLFANHNAKTLRIKQIRKTQRDSILNTGITGILERIKAKKVSISKIDSNLITDTYEISFPNYIEGVYVFQINKKSGYIEEALITYYEYDENRDIQLYKMKIQYSEYKIVKQFNPINEYLLIDSKGFQIKEKYNSYKKI